MKLELEASHPLAIAVRAAFEPPTTRRVLLTIQSFDQDWNPIDVEHFDVDEWTIKGSTWTAKLTNLREVLARLREFRAWPGNWG